MKLSQSEFYLIFLAPVRRLNCAVHGVNHCGTDKCSQNESSVQRVIRWMALSKYKPTGARKITIRLISDFKLN